MSALFTVVARTSNGWRSPPTIPAMTLEQARAKCQDLCERFPNQHFDILGVVAMSKKTTQVSLEVTSPDALNFDPEATILTHSAKVMPLRGNA